MSGDPWSGYTLRRQCFSSGQRITPGSLSRLLLLIPASAGCEGIVVGLPVISSGNLARPSSDSQQGRRCRRFAEQIADGAFPWDIRVFLIGGWTSGPWLSYVKPHLPLRKACLARCHQRSSMWVTKSHTARCCQKGCLRPSRMSYFPMMSTCCR